MALIPKLTYPGQIDESDPAYPHGKAQNISVSGDGTGTPWERTLVNDHFGFQQALLAAAGITPSGAPDEVGTSDYLDAIQRLIDAGGVRFNASGEVLLYDVAGNPVTLLGNVYRGANGAQLDNPLNFVRALGYVNGAANNAQLRWDFSDLPRGAVIYYVRALVKPGVARPTSGDRVQLIVQSTSISGFATPVAVTDTVRADVRDDGTNATQWIVANFASSPLDLSLGAEWAAEITCGADAGVNADTVRMMNVYYTLDRLAAF